LGFLFSGLIVHYQLKSGVGIFEICEIIIGIGLYFAVPESFDLKCFILQKTKSDFCGVRSFVYQRLYSIGLAFDRIKSLIDEISVRFGDHDSKVLVQTHLQTFSEICKGISDKIEDNVLVSEENSEKIKYFIEKTFKIETKVACVENEFRHTFVQIEFPRGIPENIETLAEEISYICGKPFAKAEKFVNDSFSTLRFCEKPMFKIRMNSCQHSRRSGRYCGDSFRSFYDGFGSFFVILSDGMGTGGEAAISAEMATEIMSHMIQSGVALDSAIEIANSSLMVKSSDESLATLDIFKFDLFTGSASFIKMGASVTFVKKGDKVMKIKAETLPAGIFPGTDFREIPLDLDDGDIVLMVSDGATDIGDSWIKDEISYRDYTDNLAKHIVGSAKLKRSYENDDDITAISVSISK
jgi:stage II sporulation protein E